MHFNELKKLILTGNERLILVEDGKPTVVLLSFEDYKKNFNPSKESKETGSKKQEALQESPPLPEPQPEPPQAEKKEKDLTLEDLPF